MLKASLIGKFDIQYDGKPVILSSRAAQSLIAYLIITAGTLHRREKLAGMLWPEESEQKSRAYLRNELWRIRKALPHTSNVEYLLADNLTVGFNPSSVYWLDVEELKSLHDSDSAEDLMQALSKYQGELLPGFYEDWVVLEREHLQILFEEKMACLLAVLEKEQRWNDILEWAERWITLGQAPEVAFQALMVAYDALGDYAKVTSTYERCKKALHELDLEPSEQTRALAFKRNSKIKVPIPLTSFIGREKELEEVAGLFSKTRLVTLTGSGGVGKTRLAIQVVAEILDLFPDGVWFLDLAPLSDPALVPNTLASLIGLRESGEIAVIDLLINYLHSRKALVIFDNCEHLIKSCAQLGHSLLTSCEHLSILATSREALRVSGERPYRVPSLEIPMLGIEIAIEELSNMESVKLFVERAMVVSSSFAINSRNALAIAQICQRLDGIPLALELSAARVKMLTVEQIARLLDDRFNLLTGGLRTTLRRHQTLITAIDWSYDLLSETERSLFRALAIFGGGFTLDAVAEVVIGDDVSQFNLIKLLEQLIDKSLVTVGAYPEASNTGIRYSMLETIREYARKKLDESGGTDRLRQRHCHFFVRLVEQAAPKLKGVEQFEWLDRLAIDHDNLRVAWDYSINNNVDWALRLASGLMRFWLMRGNATEGREWSTNLLVRVNRLEESAKRAHALNLAGWTANIQQDYTAARELFEQALSIARMSGDKREVAFALQWIGRIANIDGDTQTAQICIEEYSPIYYELQDHWEIAMTMFHSAAVAFKKGDYAEAEEQYMKSLSKFQDLGDRYRVGMMLNSLGELMRLQDDYDRACKYYEANIEIFRELGTHGSLATPLFNMGWVMLHRGDFRKARALFEESLNLSKEDGDRLGMMDCIAGFASVLSMTGKSVQAAQLFAAAESLTLGLGISGRRNAPDQKEFDHYLADLLAQIDADTFAKEWETGHAMTFDEAIAYALKELQ